jgi:hypothetical protein
MGGLGRSSGKVFHCPVGHFVQLTDRSILLLQPHPRRTIMPTAIANGANEAEQRAARDANEVQDGVNLIAIVGCFHRHLRAMRNSGVCGDNLNNHPVSIAFISKLNALCRLTNGREIAALIAIDRIEDGEKVEYEVVPI